MKTDLTKSFSHGFELTEQELRRLYDTIVKQVKVYGTSSIKKHFVIKYKNNIQSEKASLEEVINESNSNKWLIQELKITVERTTSEAKVTVHFRVPPPVRKEQVQTAYSIEYSIIGDDRDWVYLTGSQIDDRISKIKLSRVDLYGTIAVVFGLVVVIFSADSFSPSSNIHVPLGYKISALILSFLLAIGGLVTIYGFPQYNFYWGDYIKTVNNRRLIAKYIINTVIIALVVGVIGGIISTLFFAK